MNAYNRFTRSLSLILSILVLSACSSDSSNTPAGHSVNNFSEIPGLLEIYNVPGVSIAIIKDYEIDQLLAFGIKNQSTLAPVTKDTLFQAASMSKSVAAVAAMKMSQNGMIDLDEDINNKLVSWTVEDNIHTTEEKVNLRRLLSHTAGTTVHGFAGYRQDEETPSLVEILNGQAPANSAAVKVDNTPGSTFSYSGGGYIVAQQALIDLAQQPFEDILRETVLEPLGMKSSSFNQLLTEEQLSSASAGHDTNGLNIMGDYNRYPEMSAAGLWTTPEDLAYFLIELQLALRNQSDKVLTGDAVEEMITPVSGPIFGTEDLFYGLGFMNSQQGDKVYFGHAGNQAGFHSQMAATRSGTGYVVMTNGDHGPALIEEIVTLIEKEETQDSTQL